MSDNRTFKPHLLIGSNLLIYFAWLFRLNNSIKRKSIGRLFVSFFILLAFLPFRMIEHFLYFFSKKEEVKAPIFIIGHPRSGTTLMHDALNEMEELAAPRMIDCLFPFMNRYFEFVLVPLLKKNLPENRLMDRMQVRWDSAQEEEFGMALQSGHSAVNFLFAPKNADKVMKRYVLFQDTAFKRRWQKAHIRFARKIQSINKGKTLVFKSPGNTARVEELLEIYPDAKFIHIVRDPRSVIPSTFHLYEKILPEFSLQNELDFDLEGYIFKYYEEIMGKYLSSRSALKESQLYELRFEDFVSSPITTLNLAFEQLNIDANSTQFNTFFESRKNFTKNKFTDSPDRSVEIGKHCKLVSEEYHYQS